MWLKLRKYFYFGSILKKKVQNQLPVEKYLKRFDKIEISDLKKIVHFYGNETKVKKSFVIKPPVLDFRKQFYFCHSFKRVPKTKSLRIIFIF